MKDTREKYRKEYKNFIKTEEGKRWQNLWKMETGSDRIGGDYGDYLYDFHPELLQWEVNYNFKENIKWKIY